MAALTSAIIAIVALALGWITIEIACKPCLEKGREAIDRSLDPNYDPDDNDDSIRAPLNQDQQHPHSDSDSSAAIAATSTTKIV
ncbi:outer envelope membrane protein 7 [Magnolia sinica]|uniref:outer envelope membrane protein 7 n=1 Tax=Magnolia sinica TaxID=86752 RepID=UPI00265AB924|nr:outer envelope membrane protein 7 [Magnolia sinica]